VDPAVLDGLYCVRELEKLAGGSFRVSVRAFGGVFHRAESEMKPISVIHEIILTHSGLTLAFIFHRFF
jgi:hypothetical protein